MKNIFFTRCLVKDVVCCLVIDKKYWINIASTTMVKKLRLPVLEHPEPYQLISLEDPEFKSMGDRDVMVTKQVRVSFKLEEYEAEVLCDVVPTKTKHLLLGRPWRKQRQARHDSYTHKYSFLFNNREVILATLAISMMEKSENIITSEKEFIEEKLVNNDTDEGKETKDKEEKVQKIV